MIMNILFDNGFCFLPTSDFSVVFKISSSHDITDLQNRHFSHEQFLTSKYLSILYALLRSQ